MAILLDNVLQISISDLKKWGYLIPEREKTGTLSWSRNGEKIGSISIKVSMRFDYIELDYTHNGERVKYQISLVSLPSNIGKGRVLYFECPHTGKLCRKLYSVGKYFLHREAFKGCIYYVQTQSRQDRLYRFVRTPDNLHQQLHGKYFKRTYNGKPTKKYIRLMRKIQYAEMVSQQGLRLLWQKLKK